MTWKFWWVHAALWCVQLRPWRIPTFRPMSQKMLIGRVVQSQRLISEHRRDQVSSIDLVFTWLKWYGDGWEQSHRGPYRDYFLQLYVVMAYIEFSIQVCLWILHLVCFLGVWGHLYFFWMSRSCPCCWRCHILVWWCVDKVKCITLKKRVTWILDFYTQVIHIEEALPGVLGSSGKGYLFQGNRGTKVKFWGEQRQYWGTGNIRKQIFDFGGTGEQADLFQGNKATGTPPPPPGRASLKLVDHWWSWRN